MLCFAMEILLIQDQVPLHPLSCSSLFTLCLYTQHSVPELCMMKPTALPRLRFKGVLLANA